MERGEQKSIRQGGRERQGEAGMREGEGEEGWMGSNRAQVCVNLPHCMCVRDEVAGF